MYSRDSIAGHALVVQERCIYAAVPFALAWMVLAIFDLERWAVASAILGSVAIGAGIGSWLVAERFKD